MDNNFKQLYEAAVNRSRNRVYDMIAAKIYSDDNDNGAVYLSSLPRELWDELKDAGFQVAHYSTGGRVSSSGVSIAWAFSDITRQ